MTQHNDRHFCKLPMPGKTAGKTWEALLNQFTWQPGTDITVGFIAGEGRGSGAVGTGSVHLGRADASTDRECPVIGAPEPFLHAGARTYLPDHRSSITARRTP